MERHEKAEKLSAIGLSALLEQAGVGDDEHDGAAEVGLRLLGRGVGELRGGGSAEAAPPGAGRRGKAFYATNPDVGAALEQQARRLDVSLKARDEQR